MLLRDQEAALNSEPTDFFRLASAHAPLPWLRTQIMLISVMGNFIKRWEGISWIEQGYRTQRVP